MFRIVTLAPTRGPWDPVLEASQRVQRVCLIPGCGKPHTARGLCQAHYRQEARRAKRQARAGWQPQQPLSEVGWGPPRRRGAG